MRLCLENQYINDIQVEHYADGGCRCTLCSSKRSELFIKVKNGESLNERIIHRELSETRVQNARNKIKSAIVKRKPSKFGPNQFSIKLSKNTGVWS
jgi:hypothetical protein